MDPTKLDFQGAEKFEVLPAWRTSGASNPLSGRLTTIKAGHRAQRKRRDRTTLNFAIAMEENDAVPEHRTVCAKHIVTPNSPKRGMWDLASLMFVIYDMIVVPLQLFDPPDTWFSKVASWGSRLFWTADIWATFMTGILQKDGTIEMKPFKIAKRYLMTWFCLDVTIVLTDWMEVFLLNNTGRIGYERIGKASRVFRILRMIRLLRLFRMRQVIKLITERIRSEKLTIFADMMKIIILIVGLGHLIACIWYGIGASGPPEKNWVTAFELDESPLGYKYSTSLHWSLSQFAGGMDEVRPHNVNERVFAVFIFLFAFTGATVFVSSLTSAMTRLHIIGGQRSQQLATLRRYLNDNHISNRLAIRVVRNAQHALWEQTRSIPEANVELLFVVSEALRVELHFEMYSPVYSRHHFFMRYIEKCPQVMCRVCHKATSMLAPSTGDVVFNAGETPPCPKMYFVLTGKMRYVSIAGNASEVNEQEWLAEAVLWTHWMHLGTLDAQVECNLCLLDSKMFQDIVGQFDHPDFDPRQYAEEFVDELNSAEGDLSDLPSTTENSYYDPNPIVSFWPFHAQRRQTDNCPGAGYVAGE